MNFTTHSFLKVCVGNYTIFVPVKFFIDLVKGLIVYLKTPMVKVKLEFFSCNPTILILAKIMKALLDSFPLLLNLL